MAAYRKAIKDVRSVNNRLRSKQHVVFRLNHMSEQAPNPDSRVTLIEERDALGRQRVCLNWKFTPLDIHTIVRGQEIIDEEFRRAGLGKLQIELKDNTIPPDIHGGWHLSPYNIDSEEVPETKK